MKACLGLGIEQAGPSQPTLCRHRQQMQALGLEQRYQSRLRDLLEALELVGDDEPVLIDSVPIVGAGQQLDTYNLLGAAVRRGLLALARSRDRAPKAIAAELGLDRYLGRSIKGRFEVDTSSEASKLAKEGGAYISAVYVAEDEARRRKLRGAALRVWRQKKVRPIQRELRAWMDAVEPSLTPDDPLAKIVRYDRNYWDALFRFVDHPEIPPDNLASEREYQHVAKMRGLCLFAGSTEGAHRTATLLGIVATCRNNGVDPLAYLAWAFTRLGTHRDVYQLSAGDLTPAAYARAGPDA